MADRDYQVLDVFAEGPLEGNPLTVVVDGAGLTDLQMQRIARETNHSETTFVTGPAVDGAWPVRIFTPTLELPFAGHPTLGTAALLMAGDQTVLDLAAGKVPVRRDGDLYWMVQPPITHDGRLDDGVVARVLGVQPVGPTQIWTAGAPMGFVPLADSNAVRAARFDLHAWNAAGVDPEIAGLYAYTTSSDVPGADVHARFFADPVGITEDPATGSAAGPLAARLAAERGAPVAGVMAQGVEMGRPSRLHYRADGSGTVEVGGKVVEVARGRFTFGA